MPSVDNRVVRMEFDNAAFERKIASTIKTLGDLDKALQMKGASKGLADVSATANSMNFNPLTSAVSGLSSSFLAMSTIAVTALATVTHAAITAGASFTKSLTLDPILEGFKEFELNMGSIQTILANTKSEGTNLQQVNDALDQLNEYSDQTIYNFGQMTRSIGMFTAAGVDLQTSVNSIKGISNLAAISGSSSEQAATAMYQLSQAISTGTVKLMDWNSVVNAGMGGEVFQKALFESGKALQTIEGIPMDTTFEEWTSKGNSFRDSLQDGWLTAEVLTTTLEGIGGELSEAELIAKGFSQAQARALVELGTLGIESATKIRTLTQLITTVKESIASGWSESFRTVIGDFEQSTELFTKINDKISGFVKSSSEARNEILSGWAKLGGRDLLIDSLSSAFSSLGKVLGTIRDAFRDVFPPATAQTLLSLTQRFADFVQTLKPSERTLQNIGRIFKGVFSAIDIGITVIREVTSFIKDLVVAFLGLGEGNILGITANIADFFTNLRNGLRGGEAISAFFDRLRDAAEGPIEVLRQVREAVMDFFSNLDFGKADEAGDKTNRLSQRLDQLGSAFDGLSRVADVIQGVFERVGQVFEAIGEVIGDWFSELGDKLADAIGPGDFDKVLDALNVSLLGGIVLLLRKFIKGGLNVDFGGGFFGGVTDALNELTGVLTAMQTSIRADALLKIAGAIALLTASVTVLSLIDSAALTRALTAMAVGFGQLMGAFALLNAMSLSLTGAGSFTVVAAGMVVMAGAVTVLSAAVAILANMSWGELLKGLTGVTVLLAAMTGAAILLSKFSGQILLSSIGLVAMAGAIVILAGAVSILAKLSWSELLKGLGSLAIILGVVVGAAVLLSKHAGGMLASSVGLMAMGGALTILAGAVAILGNMDLATLGKGIGAIAVMLGLLVGASVLLSKHVAGIALTSVALVALAVAMNIMAGAMRILGDMSWGEIAKGLVALAGGMAVMVISANLMSSALPGAAAMVIMSAAIAILAKTLIELAKVPFGDLLKAIGAIALALGVFAGVAFLVQAAIPALLGLGAAMLLLGGAFALFGIGAYAAAKAFETIAEVGPEAAEAMIAALEALGQALPAVFTGLAKGIINFVQTLADAAPVLVAALGAILLQMLETLEELLPAVGDLISAVIETVLEIIQENYPLLVETGLGMLMALLQGISDNIGEIATIVGDIIVELILALGENQQRIIDAGVKVLTDFLTGIGQNVSSIVTAATNLITTIVTALGANAGRLVGAGLAALTAFISGITNNLIRVVNAVGTMIAKFIEAVGQNATKIANSGTNALIKFLAGITNNLYRVVTAVGSVITTFINAVAAQAGRVVTAGANSIIKFVQGLGQNAGRVVTAGVTAVLKFLQGVGQNAIRLARGAADVIIQFLNGLASAIREKSPQLREAGWNVAMAIIDGITGGLGSAVGRVADKARSLASSALGAAGDFLGIGSPSKEFFKIGAWMAEGMANGLDKDRLASSAAVNLARRVHSSVQRAINSAMADVDTIATVDPVITPVLDLTKVRQEAARIAGYIQGGVIVPDAQFQQAQLFATSPVPRSDIGGTTESGPTEIKFEQTINAPTELGTADIYRQTRNLITVAKEELNVA